MVELDRLGLVGQTIDGRYAIDKVIGEGGVGAVYRAEHTRLGRTVAIKFLHREYAKDQEALQRFFNEARAAATLGHANIAESLDMGELADGVPYLVLEFLDGRSLADAIHHAKQLSLRRALKIARQIACGLEVAHEHEIIHRDLKSENVFLTHRDDNPEHVKILDFGVARMLGRPSPTKPGHLVGTPDFMPPEQIADPDNIDHRVDVYAAGVILYHMLSGHKPYGDDVPIQTLLHRILHEEPAPLPPVIPTEVRRLVEDAMARDRNRRIESMAALRDRIDQLMPLGAVTPFPVSTMPKLTAPPSGTPLHTVAVPMTSVPASSVKPPVAARMDRRWIAFGLPVLVAFAIVAFLALRSPTTPPATPVPPPTAMTSIPPAEPAPAPIPTKRRVVGPAVAADPVPADPVPAPTPAPHAAQPTKPARPSPRPAEVVHRPNEPAHVGATTPAKPASPSTTPTPTPTPTTTPLPTPVATKEPATPPTQPQAPTQPTSPAPAAQPKLDVQAIRAAVSSKLGPIQQCFERAKMDDADLQGTVMVKIQVGADGAVTSAQVASSTLGSPSAEHCITGVISSWHLPANVAATFNYPFVFR